MTLIVNVDQLQSADDQIKQCRICLDSENGDDMISPCLCSGSAAYVHRKCLNYWRSQNTGGRTFEYCDICHFKYVIETVIYDAEADRRRLMKYYLFVIRDLTAIILLIQVVIIGVAFLLKTIDKSGNNIKHFYPASINEFVMYYLCAFILLMAIIGFIALVIFCQSSGGSLTGNNWFRSGGTSANGVFVIIIVMVLIFALIGMFVGVFFSVVIFKQIMNRHTAKLWLQQEADKYTVRDFQGRKSELEDYRRNLSSQS